MGLIAIGILIILFSIWSVIARKRAEKEEEEKEARLRALNEKLKRQIANKKEKHNDKNDNI